MPPFLAGGEMIREVHLRRSEFNEIPWKFEAGTPAVADAIGLGSRPEYLMDIGMDAVREHERELVAYALEVLPREVPAIELYGPLDPDAARRRRPVQPARHPSARRGPGAGPLRHRRPGRPPLHDAAPRTTRPRGHRPRLVQRLLDDRATSTPWRAASTRSCASSTGSRPAHARDCVARPRPPPVVAGFPRMRPPRRHGIVVPLRSRRG